MANKEEVTKSGANKVTEGVHVNHSYDQFKKITYSNSTWRVNIYDTSELIRRAFLTMQRRVGDDGKVENYMQLQLRAQAEAGCLESGSEGTISLSK